MNNTNNIFYEDEMILKLKNILLRYLDVNALEKSTQQVVLNFMKVVKRYPVESSMFLLFMVHILVLFMLFRNYYKRILDSIDNINIYVKNVNNSVVYKNDYDDIIDDFYTRIEGIEEYLRKDKNYSIIKQIKDILDKDERSVKKISKIEQLLQ